MKPSVTLTVEQKKEFAQLKQVLRNNQDSVRKWAEAGIEIYTKGYWKAEAKSWKEWIEKHTPFDYDTVKAMFYRERKAEATRLIAETTGEEITRDNNNSSDHKQVNDVHRVIDVPVINKESSSESVAPEPPKKKKGSDLEQLVDHTGFPVPASCLKVWTRSGEVQQVLQTLIGLKSLLSHAKSDRDMLWMPIQFEECLADLSQAYQRCKQAIPYAVCPSCQGKLAERCTFCRGRGIITELQWQVGVTDDMKALRAKAAAAKKK